jgi:hypothetical protein
MPWQGLPRRWSLGLLRLRRIVAPSLLRVHDAQAHFVIPFHRPPSVSAVGIQRWSLEMIPRHLRLVRLPLGSLLAATTPCSTPDQLLLATRTLNARCYCVRTRYKAHPLVGDWVARV